MMNRIRERLAKLKREEAERAACTAELRKRCKEARRAMVAAKEAHHKTFDNLDEIDKLREGR